MEEKIVGGEEALATARQMFQVHKIIHMYEVENIVNTLSSFKTNIV